MKKSAQIAKQIADLKLEFEAAKKREREERTVGRSKRLQSMAKKAGVFDLTDEDFQSIELLFIQFVASKTKQSDLDGGISHEQ